jgi:hypothetical protein
VSNGDTGSDQEQETLFIVNLGDIELSEDQIYAIRSEIVRVIMAQIQDPSVPPDPRAYYRRSSGRNIS